MPPDVLPPPRRNLILGGLLLAVFLAAVESTVVATAMPTVIADLSGLDWYGWVGAAYLLVATVTMPIYGRLSDTFGRRPILVVGIVLFLLGSVLSGMSQSMFQLIAARALQGAGAGAIQPVAMTVVGDLYTLEERAKVQAIVGAVWGFSGAVGPLLGGFIVSAVSWRWVFWFNVPFGIAAIVVLLAVFHERREKGARAKLDWQGAVLLSAGSSLLLLASGGTYAGPLLAVAVALFVLFYFQERRAPAPLIPLPLLARSHVAVASISSLMLGAIMMGVVTFVPLYVQGVLGDSPTKAGVAVAPMLIGWPIAAATMSRFLSRVGFRRPVIFGSGAVALGALLLAWGIQTHSGLSVLWLGSFTLGLGMGVTTTSLMIALQMSVRWELRGIVTATNMFARTMGGALGIGVLGAVLALLLRSHLSAAEVRGLLDVHRPGVVPSHAGFLATGLRPLFWGMGALGALNVLCVLFYPRQVPPPELPRSAAVSG